MPLQDPGAIPPAVVEISLKEFDSRSTVVNSCQVKGLARMDDNSRMNPRVLKL